MSFSTVQRRVQAVVDSASIAADELIECGKQCVVQTLLAITLRRSTVKCELDELSPEVSVKRVLGKPKAVGAFACAPHDLQDPPTYVIRRRLMVVRAHPFSQVPLLGRPQSRSLSVTLPDDSGICEA